jgi:hypothetical protein
MIIVVIITITFSFAKVPEVNSVDKCMLRASVIVLGDSVLHHRYALVILRISTTQSNICILSINTINSVYRTELSRTHSYRAR